MDVSFNKMNVVTDQYHFRWIVEHLKCNTNRLIKVCNNMSLAMTNLLEFQKIIVALDEADNPANNVLVLEALIWITPESINTFLAVSDSKLGNDITFKLNIIECWRKLLQIVSSQTSEILRIMFDKDVVVHTKVFVDNPLLFRIQDK
jgi:hypothetical protein